MEGEEQGGREGRGGGREREGREGGVGGVEEGRGKEGREGGERERERGGRGGRRGGGERGGRGEGGGGGRGEGGEEVGWEGEGGGGGGERGGGGGGREGRGEGGEEAKGGGRSEDEPDGVPGEATSLPGCESSARMTSAIGGAVRPPLPPPVSARPSRPAGSQRRRRRACRRGPGSGRRTAGRALQLHPSACAGSPTSWRRRPNWSDQTNGGCAGSGSRLEQRLAAPTPPRRRPSSGP